VGERAAEVLAAKAASRPAGIADALEPEDLPEVEEEE
jgi:hypothetical protein